MLIEQIVSGIALGLIYGLVALGFSLVYRTMRLVNFAHGDMFMVFAFVVLSLMNTLNMPYALAICLTTVGAFVGGLILYWVVLNHAAKLSELNLMIATIGLSLVLRDTALLTFGAGEQRYQVDLDSSILTLRHYNVSRSILIITVVAVIAVALLWFFLYRTVSGIRLRATSQDTFMCRLMGIKVDRVQSVAFGLSAASASIAGTLIGPIWMISYGIGSLIGLKGFTAAIIGGYGNLRGAVIGGLALGVTETLLAGYVSSTWRDALVFVILIVVLVLRPTGILSGYRMRES